MTDRRIPLALISITPTELAERTARVNCVAAVSFTQADLMKIILDLEALPSDDDFDDEREAAKRNG